MGKAAALVEALEGGHDALRVDGVHLLPAKAQLLHVTGANVLYKHVGVLEEVGEDLLGSIVLHIQGDGLLVGVQLQIVQRVRAVDVVHLVAGGVAAVDLLQLDDLCA